MVTSVRAAHWTSASVPMTALAGTTQGQTSRLSLTWSSTLQLALTDMATRACTALELTVYPSTAGAQWIVASILPEDNFKCSVASVRTQHSGGAKTAIITTVMELSGDMESGAGAVNNIVTIRLIDNMIMKHIVLVVIWLSVKTRVIRYLTNSHSAT